MGTWMNKDGLYIRYGHDEGKTGRAGEYGDGLYGNRVEEVIINLTELNTSTNTILDDMVRIPKDHRVEKVEVYVDVAATSSGSATLDVGLVKSDRTTEDDYNGLVAALALASIDAKGDVVRLDVGTSGAGALIGTETTNAGSLLTAKAGTAVFTAGRLRVRIYLRAVYPGLASPSA